MHIERFIFYDRQAKGISEESGFYLRDHSSGWKRGEGLTPECTASIAEALAARELVKIGILQNYDGDLEELARTAAERTRSQLIQVIGRKFVLYKEGRDEKKRIILPPAGKKS